MMKKYCALLLLLVSVLSLSSCSNRIERLQRQVRLEGIEPPSAGSEPDTLSIKPQAYIFVL